ncbi:MAG: hypothetical protein CHACPFDD_01828 [Phycisphaerae bacterium]|nr:hypothetical protein [Phycisphaerae bacterium]
MRKWGLIIGVGASLVCGGSIALGDNEHVGDIVRFIDAAGSGPGGEFELDNLSRASVANFRTFCIQRTEYIDYSSHGFRVVGVTHAAHPVNDPLSAQAAFLYQSFREGTLAGYNYGVTRASSADELQEVIWYLEGEIGSVNGQAATWLSMANTAVAAGGSWYNRYGNGAGGYDGLDYLGNVRVLNLVWATARHGFRIGDAAQDQLTMIPAPGAALLGVIGLAIARRFRR